MATSISQALIPLVRFVLVASVAAQAFIIFSIQDSALRMYAGMMMTGIMLWAGLWLARQTAAMEVVAAQPVRRPFSKLRGVVQELLAEISRLNWAVLDSKRGFRDPATAASEIDEIKGRMTEILEKVKMAAENPAKPEEEPRLPRRPRWTIEAPSSRID